MLIRFSFRFRSSKRVLLISWHILKLWEIESRLWLFLHIDSKGYAISGRNAFSSILISCEFDFRCRVNLFEWTSLTHIINDVFSWWFENVKDGIYTLSIAFVSWCFERIWLLLCFCFKRIRLFLFKHVVSKRILLCFCFKRILTQRKFIGFKWILSSWRMTCFLFFFKGLLIKRICRRSIRCLWIIFITMTTLCIKWILTRLSSCFSNHSTKITSWKRIWRTLSSHIYIWVKLRLKFKYIALRNRMLSWFLLELIEEIKRFIVLWYLWLYYLTL